MEDILCAYCQHSHTDSLGRLCRPSEPNPGKVFHSHGAEALDMACQCLQNIFTSVNNTNPLRISFTQGFLHDSHKFTAL